MEKVGNTIWASEEPGPDSRLSSGHGGEADAPKPARTVSVFRAGAGTDSTESADNTDRTATTERTPAGHAGSPVDTNTEVPAGSTSDGAASGTAGSAVPAGSSASAGSSAPSGSVDDGTASGSAGSAGVFPDGFSGVLALAGVESFTDQATGEALAQINHLISWASAQQARLMNRMQEVFEQSTRKASGISDPGMAFSLAASECATILNLPQITGQRLLFEADRLCTTHTTTLTALDDGALSYAHAQVVIDQCLDIPAGQVPGFEADLLAAAPGQTRAQFAVRARRLRERTYPESVPVRHRSAFEKRKVTLDREADGMSCLSAYLQAAEAQQIYTVLSAAARGERDHGDPRTTDQLRADILAQLLMGGHHTPQTAGTGNSGTGRTTSRTGGSGATGSSSGHVGSSGGGIGSCGGGMSSGGGRVGSTDGGVTGSGGIGSREYGLSGMTPGKRNDGIRTSPDTSGPETGMAATEPDTGPDPADPDTAGMVPRAEIMVLINAETLFGANNEPAELHGYGPITAEAARILARNARHWTGLVQDPRTGEVLAVGRRRKVPAGLARWLRARDATCRFPGCRTSTATTEIDHTTDWAAGGGTDHGNLAHLCRRHHRYKTLGYWKATQPTPGVIEWTSPTGRTYRTEPFLRLAPRAGYDPRKDYPPEPEPEPEPPEQQHAVPIIHTPPPF